MQLWWEVGGTRSVIEISEFIYKVLKFWENCNTYSFKEPKQSLKIPQNIKIVSLFGVSPWGSWGLWKKNSQCKKYISVLLVTFIIRICFDHWFFRLSKQPFFGQTERNKCWGEAAFDRFLRVTTNADSLKNSCLQIFKKFVASF